MFCPLTADRTCAILYPDKPMKRRSNRSCPHREPVALGIGRETSRQMDRRGRGQRHFRRVPRDVWAYVSCREYAGTPQSAWPLGPRSKVAPRAIFRPSLTESQSRTGVFILPGPDGGGGDHGGTAPHIPYLRGAVPPGVHPDPGGEYHTGKLHSSLASHPARIRTVPAPAGTVQRARKISV